MIRNYDVGRPVSKFRFYALRPTNLDIALTYAITCCRLRVVRRIYIVKTPHFVLFNRIIV